jgi:NADPH:quinone reductase-like Zn-dependent oxidoreductase
MLDFIEGRKLRPVIDKVFPLEQTEEAMNRMNKGEQFGKIILQIS